MLQRRDGEHFNFISIGLRSINQPRGVRDDVSLVVDEKVPHLDALRRERVVTHFRQSTRQHAHQRALPHVRCTDERDCGRLELRHRKLPEQLGDGFQIVHAPRVLSVIRLHLREPLLSHLFRLFQRRRLRDLRRVPFTYPKHPLPHRIHRRERRSILFIAQRQLQQRPLKRVQPLRRRKPLHVLLQRFTHPRRQRVELFRALIPLPRRILQSPRRRHPSRSFHRARDQLLRGRHVRQPSERPWTVRSPRRRPHRSVRSRVRVFAIRLASSRPVARARRRRRRVVVRLAAATARARRRRRRRRSARPRRPRSSVQRARDRSRGRRHRARVAVATARVAPCRVRRRIRATDRSLGFRV